MLWAISAALVLQLLALKSCRLAACGDKHCCGFQRGWFRMLGLVDRWLGAVDRLATAGGCRVCAICDRVGVVLVLGIRGRLIGGVANRSLVGLMATVSLDGGSSLLRPISCCLVDSRGIGACW
jgi:hypothetical protein